MSDKATTPRDFFEDLTANWTPEQWADFRRVSEEAEEPCIRCGRVILAGWISASILRQP